MKKAWKIRVSTYVRLHRSWTSPDSSTSRVHRRLVTALRPRQEVPTHSQALPVTGEVFEPHGELPPSSARTRCTYPSSYPSSEVFAPTLLPVHPSIEVYPTTHISLSILKLLPTATINVRVKMLCRLKYLKHVSAKLETTTILLNFK
jgi:hypothetical protein